MKIPCPPAILATVAFCLAAIGCAGTVADKPPRADSIKDMVMNRYDGFAKTGGECGEK